MVVRYRKAGPKYHFGSPATIFWGSILLYYAFLLLVTKGLGFPPTRDELHFWPTTLRFSHAWPPSLELLRNYGELNTPLPFIVFGLIEKWGPGGIRYGRFFNLILSFGTIIIIARPQTSTHWKRSLAAGAALLLSPYFIGVSTHLYTDMIAIFLVLCGCLLHERKLYLGSLACFILAISSRQYMVAFPAALFLNEFYRERTNFNSLAAFRRWSPPLLATGTLFAWYLFFGSFGPPEEITRQQITTTSMLNLLPQNCNYFLACLGAWFCLPEIFFNRIQERKLLSGYEYSNSFGRFAGLVLGLSFLFFPPWQNCNQIMTMGFLDRFLHLFCNDTARIIILYGLALLATIRFLKIGPDFFLVWTNVLLMAKAHIAWDKYTLPLIVVLWYHWSRQEERERGEDSSRLDNSLPTLDKDSA